MPTSVHSPLKFIRRSSIISSGAPLATPTHVFGGPDQVVGLLDEF
jgi:hypothetical protein